ncbi:MAG: hypothetical protein J2P25_18665 [Nocardiopsaceae bacterium]|nr:hypothetical protein [Nocardiopsaceae bacterium]
MRSVITDPRRWSLARQLVTLQLGVVVVAVVIEATIAVYRGPGSGGDWRQRQVLGLVTLTEVALLVGIAGSLYIADRVERQTFGMPPAEIARRYQGYDEMLDKLQDSLVRTDELLTRAHDHRNHLQTVIALIEEGHYDDAVEACVAEDEAPTAPGGRRLSHVADLVLASRLPALLERAGRGGVELRLAGTLGAVPQDLCYGLADVVGNLLRNAVEAVAAQAGRVGSGGSGGSDRWARLRLERGADGSIHVEVRDNGPGIPAEGWEKISEPGYTTKGGEHGYGLALTREKAREMGGEVRAFNDGGDGGGAVFLVSIPLDAAGREKRGVTP